eukprot:TRINITY_DN5932_c0_g1_i10.p1 TRINITY_DN5932_c0_g1~~TRINITY_DN5932_c0_g1_i10.p1  ORF type:complete len:531 (-),score=99.17 TRINITY_DN5932_c0_g1_i10:359-1789(-)
MPDAPAGDIVAGDQEELVFEEEEVTTIPGWTPSVTLQVHDVVETGEENEEELYSQRSKLYRFRDGEWKERGLGDAKLLKHRETGKVRFFMRQEKTLKVVGNHYVIEHAPYCDLQPNMGSDKCWVWSAQDCSDGDVKTERVALKFGNAELAMEFKEAFERAKIKVATEPRGREKDDDVTCVPGWTPSLTLEVTGGVGACENDELLMFSARSRLGMYRAQVWEDQGVGHAKLFRQDGTGPVRFLFREGTSARVVANHLVVTDPPFCNLSLAKGNDRTWVWSAADCSGEQSGAEVFTLTFANEQSQTDFKVAFDEAKQLNESIVKIQVPSLEPVCPQIDASVGGDNHGFEDDYRASVLYKFLQKGTSDNSFSSGTTLAETPSGSTLIFVVHEASVGDLILLGGVDVREVVNVKPLVVDQPTRYTFPEGTSVLFLHKQSRKREETTHTDIHLLRSLHGRVLDMSRKLDSLLGSRASHSDE